MALNDVQHRRCYQRRLLHTPRHQRFRRPRILRSGLVCCAYQTDNCSSIPVPHWEARLCLGGGLRGPSLTTPSLTVGMVRGGIPARSTRSSSSSGGIPPSPGARLAVSVSNLPSVLYFFPHWTRGRCGMNWDYLLRRWRRTFKNLPNRRPIFFIENLTFGCHEDVL